MFQIKSQQDLIFESLAQINFLGLQSMESSFEDSLTCSTYLEAITQNKAYIHGRKVLHITSGCNCLYSIFAAQAGAGKVYCVVNGHGEVEKKNVHMMREIVKENGLEAVIEVKFFKDFSHEVDVIIGEPMGYNLIYDGLLDRMIEARDLYMRDKAKGLMIPSRIKYKCAFVRDEHFIDKKVKFWKEPYGIKMSSMQSWISHEPMVRVVDPSLVVSEATKFIDFDTLQVQYEQIDNLKKCFCVRTPQSTLANGLSIWFEVEFSKPDGEKLEIKASPWCESTRWTQTTLYTGRGWQLEEGGHKQVEFSGKKNHLEGSCMLRLKLADYPEQIYLFS